MLQWFYIFNYLLFCSFISLIFCNKTFLSIILIGEFILLVLLAVGMVISGAYNIYFASTLGFVLLIFGGLELALNILLFLLHDTIFFK